MARATACLLEHRLAISVGVEVALDTLNVELGEGENLGELI